LTDSGLECLGICFCLHVCYGCVRWPVSQSVQSVLFAYLITLLYSALSMNSVPY